MALFRYLALLCWACLAACQTYPTLPGPLIYTDGEFTSPNTSISQLYQNGSSMLIEWIAPTYPSINLYQVFDNDYTTQWLLVGGSSAGRLQWTVTDHGLNTAPWLFRLVNAQGSAADKADGGFATGGFYITPGQQPADNPVTVTASVVTVTAAAAPMTVSSTPSLTPTSTGSTSTGTTAATATGTSTPTPTPNNNNTAIGVGVGVGVGVVVIAIAAFLVWWFYFRRRRQSHHPVAQNSPPHGTPTPAGGYYASDPTRFSDYDHTPKYSGYPSPPPPQGAVVYPKYEQQGTELVEAPNGWDEAHELHADNRAGR